MRLFVSDEEDSVTYFQKTADGNFLVQTPKKSAIDKVIDHNTSLFNAGVGKGKNLWWIGGVPNSIRDHWYREWRKQGLDKKCKFKEYELIQLSKPEYSRFRDPSIKLRNDRANRRQSFLAG